MSRLRFTSRSLAFLRSLKRHNDREWFRARRGEYETLVRAPMIAVIEALAHDLTDFAPELVASPTVSLYRDTRFSPDKSPLKTHIAAVFPTRGLAKHEGAGLYFHVSPTEVWVGGGMYAPATWQLQRVREHIASNSHRLRTITESSVFRRRVGRIDGERLQRLPRGFPADHPAAEYLKMRQFLAGREYEATFATRPRFYPTLLTLFRTVAPLVRFLNEPLVKAQTASAPVSVSPVRSMRT